MELSDIRGLLPYGLRGVRKEQEDAVRDQMPRRVWYWRDSGRDTAWYYCEHCESWHEISGRKNMPKHKREWECRCCGAYLYAYSLRRSHIDMYDDMIVTLYDMGTDGETLIARTFYAVRDYAAPAWYHESCVNDWDPRDVDTQLMPYAVCAFNLSKHSALRWEVEGIYTYKPRPAKASGAMKFYDCSLSGPEGRWIKRRGVVSPTRNIYSKTENVYGGGMSRHAVRGVYFPQELERAANGTRLGAVYALVRDDIDRCGYTRSHGYYDTEAVSPDRTEELAAICKYPQIEYLKKLGLDELALRRITNTESCAHRLNWRGRTAEAVLRIPQSEIRAARSAGVEIDGRYLDIYDLLIKEGVHARPEDIGHLRCAWFSNLHRVRTDLERFAGGRRAKALKYFVRQNRRTGLRWDELHDYWRECDQLGTDLTDDREAFPNDLHERHERNRARIVASQNRGNDEKIAKRLDELTELYGFEHEGIILRPAADAAEVIREGELLRHCVGGYVDRYAEGKTAIFVMRLAEEPEKPWRTVEIDPKSGRMVQDRGYRNDLNEITHHYEVTGELKERLDGFWDAWKDRNTFKIKTA